MASYKWSLLFSTLFITACQSTQVNEEKVVGRVDLASLPALAQADVLVQVELAKKQGDTRLLAISQRAINIPVEGDHGADLSVEQLSERCGYQFVPALGDTLSKDKTKREQDSAARYFVRKYNGLMLIHCL